MSYRVDARLSGRHPFELFTLYFSLLVSVPTVVGLAPRPGSINEALPPWLGFLWSLTLMLGSLSALIGIYFRKRGVGLILEQLGLGMVGVTNVTYAITALTIIGESASIPAAIIGGYGVAALVRYRQIQHIIDQVYREECERRSL